MPVMGRDWADMKGESRMGDASSFDKIWAEKADEELFDALAHRDQYKLEAIEAVQRQIER